MPAPSPVEIANMQTWSLFKHYGNNRKMYIAQGKVLYQATQAYLGKANTNNTGNTNQNMIITQDEIAVMVKSWLSGNHQWTTYLGSKAHLPVLLRDVLTDIMSRHIAWDGYLDITA